jgi:hypothetical protein
MRLEPPSPREATRRLRRASALADLRPEMRLVGKIGLEAGAVTARLRRASELRDLCGRLARAGAAARGAGPGPAPGA